MPEQEQISPWLFIDNISFAYTENRILDELSLTLTNDHDMLSVVGPSGVGKSTLLNLLGGFFPVDSGRIYICGERVTGASAKRPVVFQDHNLFPWKTVLSNVEFGLKSKGIPKKERMFKARELLDMMQLENVEHLYPHALSGGMRQRVGLARALAVNPSCILMDEPFNALDQETKNSVRDYFRQTLAMTNLRAVLVTHDIREAVSMGNFVLVLRGPNDAVPCDLLSTDDTKYDGHSEEQTIAARMSKVEALASTST